MITTCKLLLSGPHFNLPAHNPPPPLPQQPLNEQQDGHVDPAPDQGDDHVDAMLLQDQEHAFWPIGVPGDQPDLDEPEYEQELEQELEVEAVQPGQEDLQAVPPNPAVEAMILRMEQDKQTILEGLIPHNPIPRQGQVNDGKDYMTSNECQAEVMDIVLRHPKLAKTCVDEFVKLLGKYGESSHNYLQGDHLDVAANRQMPGCYKTIEREFMADIPNVWIDIYLWDMGSTDEEVTQFNPDLALKEDLIQLPPVLAFPIQKYPPSR